MSAIEIMKTADFNNGGGGANRPWDDSDESIARRKKIGLRVFLAVVTSLFFLFIVAFMIRSQLSDWEHLSAPWKPLADPWLLWVNSALLLLSSVGLQWARVSARKGNARHTIEGLLLGGLFALAFLAGQLWVWQQLVSLGYYMATNPANSFFYLFTGLHGLHLLGGLVAWLRTTVKAWRGTSMDQLKSSVELCAIYWHYLLVLWFVLMGLMTSSPETFAALARMCGLA